MGAHVPAAAPDASIRQPSRLEKAVILLAVVGPLAGTLLAVVLLWNRAVTALDLALLATFYVLTASGIGVGFHRMLTHRSFDAHPAVRYVFLALGSMALQGPAIEWAATHVKHHAKSDRDGDPHSPLDGFWHAHVGWLFRDRVIRDSVWGKAFEDDKLAQHIDRTFWVWAILGFVLPGFLGLWIGGTWAAFWSGVLWGGVVRVFLTHHVTWSVNSICHTFGRRTFVSNDESRNEWIVGLLGLGEGWHNNHHAFPKAAYHGMRWWQVDVNGLVIRALKGIGLVRNVWMPKPEDMEARRIRRDRPVADDPVNPVAASTTLGVAGRRRRRHREE